jgi:hypothetical protein
MRQVPSASPYLITVLGYTSYAVGSSNHAFHPVNGRIACGSMVLFFLFHKNVALRATFL